MSRRSRAKHFTPPPDLKHTGEHKHPKTPSRAGVFILKECAQLLNINIPTDTIRQLTGVSQRSQSRIIASGHVRTLHNIQDSGPDPRGRKRGLTRSDTAAIGNYLDDPDVLLDKKGKPWRTVAEEAGVTPNTTHFKPHSQRTIQPQSI